MRENETGGRGGVRKAHRLTTGDVFMARCTVFEFFTKSTKVCSHRRFQSCGAIVGCWLLLFRLLTIPNRLHETAID